MKCLFAAVLALSLCACTTGKLDPNFNHSGGFASLFGANGTGYLHMSATTDSESSESVRAFSSEGLRSALMRTKTCRKTPAPDVRI